MTKFFPCCGKNKEKDQEMLYGDFNSTPHYTPGYQNERQPQDQSRSKMYSGVDFMSTVVDRTNDDGNTG